MEGIDFYGIGPKDLAQSMGTARTDGASKRVKDFTKQVTDAVHAAGKKMSHEVIVRPTAHRTSSWRRRWRSGSRGWRTVAKEGHFPLGNSLCSVDRQRRCWIMHCRIMSL